jgi:hypothetical protein
LWTFDQILLSLQEFGSGICCPVSVCGRLTRYCFLFKSLGLEFVVLSLWGALSDERPGLSFVTQYVLVSSPLCGRLTRYCFLFKTLGLEFVVLSLWGSLFDERSVTLLLKSVSQCVLVSSPFCGRLTRYCFLFKSLGLEFVVLSLWGALSDEKPGLSFVSHSPVIRLCVHLLFTFVIHIYILHNAYNIYKAPFSPGSVQQIMPHYSLVL